MNEIKQVTGTGLPLLIDDIDTDRIIPARYLRCVTFDGLGEHAFEDDRQQDPNHPFDQPRFKNANVLIAGRNFGCGSSREHAPQALMRWGIGAVVAESFAEIFFGNCTSLGIPAVCCSRSDLKTMGDTIEADPSIPVTVDLESLKVTVGETSYDCKIPESARNSLITGQWDFLGLLLDAGPEIEATAGKSPYLNAFAK
ncbi:MAG TPA: 3-isopropylmalate dehydratase small subunit [Planctomycetaceae bacterium]|nr:3-isopropylmalate dehydratase small subunit [Planctomycetaceae bacterium]